jgi:hypothetical protein
MYDLLCILDSRKRKFDIIFQLGYTSNSVWGRLLPRRSVVVTNMDGLEWKRTKYSKKVQRFLKYAEKLAVKTSHHLVADSVGIQSYLKEKYHKNSQYIPYGTNIFKAPDAGAILPFKLRPFSYSMLIARMEPENNIETILDGVSASSLDQPFLVIGRHDNNFGKYLTEKYRGQSKIVFLGSLYDIVALNNLRYFSSIYFHGHSVGGTNPSLLEAMASNGLICAHDNMFNRSILGNDAFYFSSKENVTALMDRNIKKEEFDGYIQANLKKIETLYLWPKIIKDYETYFLSIGTEKEK